MKSRWVGALVLPLSAMGCMAEVGEEGVNDEGDGYAQSSQAVVASAPSGCPSYSSWPSLPSGPEVSWSDSQYNAIQKYNACYGSTKNYERTSQDYLIGNPSGVGGQAANLLQVRLAQSLAGGIASVKWGTQEFVASGGHGSAFGYNLVSASAGECYNPTEFGSRLDDCKDTNGNYSLSNKSNGPQCASFYKGQLHGPSSSAFYPDTGYSNGNASSFRGTTRLAHYVPETWRGFGGCTANYPAGIEESYNLSYLQLKKTVTTNSVKKMSGGSCSGSTVLNWPVVKLDASMFSDASFPVPSGNPLATADMRFAMYLPREFTHVESVSGDINWTGSHGSSSMTDHSSVSERSDPLIYSTANGWYAVGFYAQQATSTRGSVDAPYYYANHSDNNAGHEERQLQITARGYNNFTSGSSGVAGTNTYKYFAVFGSLDQVRSMMRTLATQCTGNDCC